MCRGEALEKRRRGHQGLRYKRRKRSTTLKPLRFCTLFLEVSLAELSSTFWVTVLQPKLAAHLELETHMDRKVEYDFSVFPSFYLHAFVRKYPFGNAWKVEPLSKVISLKNVK